MKNLIRAVTGAAGTVLLIIALATAAPAQPGTSPLTDEEKELMAVESNVVAVQLELSAARRRGDSPEDIEKLQKKFDKLQKKRKSLLQATWQM